MLFTYLALLLTIPLAYLLAKLTDDEKNIYLKMPYFPLIIPLLVLLTILSGFFWESSTMPLLFLTLTVFFWKVFSTGGVFCNGK